MSDNNNNTDQPLQDSTPAEEVVETPIEETPKSSESEATPTVIASEAKQSDSEDNPTQIATVAPEGEPRND